MDNGGIIKYPSDIAYGTWSFDVFLKPTKIVLFAPIIINGSRFEYAYDYWFEIKSWKGITEFYLGHEFGTYPDNNFGLDSYAIITDLTEQWHHIDITRDLEGRFHIYFNGEHIMDAINNKITTSKYFTIYSDPFGFLIDNITVRNVVNFALPVPLDAPVEISQEEVTQGDDVLVTIEVKDDYGVLITDASVDVIFDEKMVDVSEVSWGVYQAVVDTSEHLGTVELIVTAEKTGFIPSESIYNIEVVAPASFVTNELSLEPSIVEKGKQAAVTAKVTNVGGQVGSYQLLVDIEGVVNEEITITLEPGASETVFYEFFATEAGTFTVEVDGLTETLTVVEPATFELANLVIDPASVREGESISISVDCMNAGGVSGSFDVILEVDGETEDTSTVTLDAGESTTVIFDISATQEGTYSVEVEGLTGSYTVERLQRGIPGFPLESITLGLLTGAVLLWIIHRNRSSHFPSKPLNLLQPFLDHEFCRY
jgi:hypothetical protein